MRKLAIVTATLLVLAAVPAAADPGNGNGQVEGPTTITGSVGTANYEILVPEDWNGTLLVYAHGYTGETAPLNASAGPAAEYFASLGYAVAGSSYAANGWAVKEGIRDTKTLVSLFRGKVGVPDRTILWGFSMGSVVTFASAEKYPQFYDGTIAACAVGAGTTRAWSAGAGLLAAYDVLFGMPESWGTPLDVDDHIDAATEVFPKLISELSDPANLPKFEMLRLITDLPAEDFYSGNNWLFTDMFFSTQYRGELERRIGGSPVDNVGYHYELDAGDRAYLAAISGGALTDADFDAFEDGVNGWTGNEPHPSAANYLEKYADYSGDITKPMLTLHTRVDGLVPIEHESAYAETVAAAGNSGLLVRAYVDSVGHCAFTGEQLITSVAAMESWLDTGVAPTDAWFPAALGFMPGYEPAPWPQP